MWKLVFLTLSACAVTQGGGFDLSLRYAYRESVAVEQESQAATEHGQMTPETAQHVLILNKQLREVLASAEQAHAEGNAAVAQDRLMLGRSLLDELKAFVVVKTTAAPIPPPKE